MIVLIEPISNNIGMYVPAYPLPIMEIAGYLKAREPGLEVKVISVPMDYGLPLNPIGKKRIYEHLTNDLSRLGPLAVGVSCTAISQAEESVELCERIKRISPDIFVFMGGYFPTIYPEEIFSRTSAVDLIVAGEGEMAAYEIVRAVTRGENPKNRHISNLVWKEGDDIRRTKRGVRFDLNQKALINPELLKNPDAYDILPYAFSRGCPFKCSFCLEDHIRPKRQEVPHDIVEKDLRNLFRRDGSRTLVVADALFRSFHLLPLFRSFGIRINFETRCDVMEPAVIPELADVCGVLALGLESASYNTLKRMNKVRDKAHYERYIRNAKKIFKEAARHNVSMMVFMIAGYPGDTVSDLEESLLFVKELSEMGGPGGHVFKIGECHVYPKTKIFDLANALPDVVFDNDGVFGQNTVRQSSRGVRFDTILNYINEIYSLSNPTPGFQQALRKIMPFFRLPAPALQDTIIPKACFGDGVRDIFMVRRKNLDMFRRSLPMLIDKYKLRMAGERSERKLKI